MAFELIQLKATARPRVGKGAARQARREGNVPAVIYGGNKPPSPITLDNHALSLELKKGRFTSTVVEVDFEGKKEKVIPREVQLDPIRDTPVHVDLMRIAADGIIRVEVPVRFVNDEASPGLKRGGVLNIVRHEIEVFCPFDKMPPYFEIDLEGLEIGASVHISSIKLGDGIKPVIHDRDFTVATIAGAVKQEVEEEAAEEAVEGEEAAASEDGDKTTEADAEGADKDAKKDTKKDSKKDSKK